MVKILRCRSVGSNCDVVTRPHMKNQTNSSAWSLDSFTRFGKAEARQTLKEAFRMRARRLMRQPAVVVAFMVVVGILMQAGPVSASGHIWFQGFEEDTSGWVDFGSGTVNREPSGYSNAGGYADGIDSADGNWHARLRTTQTGGCAPPFSQATSCVGPFTRWGKATTTNPTFPTGGYVTQVDVYLDVDWAANNPDWRFDFSSAINRSSDGSHLRDFVFNAGTSPGGNPEWIVNASTNAFRANSFPSNPCPSPSVPPNECRLPVSIDESGWYTFRHVFYDNDGFLAVDLSVLDANGASVADWTIYTDDEIPDVGGDRYGWFANQEVRDLAIDNSLRHNRLPQSKDDCKNGDWDLLVDDDGEPFMNQGQCIKFVNTGE